MNGNDMAEFIRTVKLWGTHYGLRLETMEPKARDHWWPVLVKHDIEDVKQAMGKAHQHNLKSREPNKMFTLPAVELALSAIARRKAETLRTELAELKNEAPADPAGPQFTPLTESQKSWVAEGENAMLRLGRRWQCEESNRLRPMTGAEGAARAREYREAIDASPEIGR
jgi:hypothetical protein